MPPIRPFPGISYARGGVPAASGAHAADLSSVVCPPYDVISERERAELLARDPHNAVRLELSAEADPHAAAASTLEAWLAEGILARDRVRRAYAYRYALPAAPELPAVSGVLAAVRLEPFGAGVRGHEQTLTGPKADRLGLLRATRTQLSPILALYFDSSPDAPRPVPAEAQQGASARDADGLLHLVSPLSPQPGLLERVSRQQLFIADGHHRYETALAFQAEVRADPRLAGAAPGSLAADWAMLVLVNAALEKLQILATHRLVRDADPEALRSLVRDPDPIWEALPVSPAELASRLHELRNAEAPVFALILPGDEGFLLIGDPDAVEARMRREPIGAAVRDLDLAILQAAILGDRLGITEERVAAGGALAYTRSEADARRAVASGEAKAAFLVRPTQLEQLAAVARAGEVMPQKSTYFYPKLLTGLVFYPVEDD